MCCWGIVSARAGFLEQSVSRVPQQILVLTPGRWQEFRGVRFAVLSFKDLVLQLLKIFFYFFSPPWAGALNCNGKWQELVLPYLAAKVHLKWLFLLFQLCPWNHQLTWNEEFESKLFWMMSEDGVDVKYCARKRHSGKQRWLGMAWQGLAAVPRALRMNEVYIPYLGMAFWWCFTWTGCLGERNSAFLRMSL